MPDALSGFDDGHEGRARWRTLFFLLLLLSTLAITLAGCGEEADPFEASDRAAIPASMREGDRNTYAVTMEPAGTLHLKQPPQRLVAHRATEAEIVVALGRADGLVAMFDRDYLLRMQELFYHQLPGFDVKLDHIANITNDEGVDKELFYQFDADVHLIDPRLPAAWWNWAPEDVAEVAEHVGPFFGNFIRLKERWGSNYQRYTLDEAFAIYAELLQREERYEAFTAFRDQVVKRVQEALPPDNERPRICIVSMASEPAQGRFYVLDLEAGGSRSQHYRELGIKQASFPSSAAGDRHGVSGYETLLEIDPDVIVVQWATVLCEDREAFEAQFLEPLAEHPLGSRLRAVQNDRVIPGGNGDMGPITHLFQLEMMAMQLFPETFGSWSWGERPARPLFDRRELAKILTAQAEDAADARR